MRPKFDSTPGVASPAVPAIRDGGPLVIARDVPSTLPRALRATTGEIVYVSANGVETRQRGADLLERAQRTCAGLRAAGVRPGDVLLLQLANTPDFVHGFWACVLAGIVPLPLPPPSDAGGRAWERLRGLAELLPRAHILADAETAPLLRHWMSAADGIGFPLLELERTQAAPEDGGIEPHPDNPALLLLTSGSTGKPKAVSLTHRNVLAQVLGSAQHNGFTRDDISLNWMPLDHVGGLVMFHVRDVILGIEQVHVPTSYILESPLRWLDLVHRHRASLTWAPDFAYGLVNARADELQGREWDLRCLRFILNGGEPIVAGRARRFLELLQPFGLPATAMHPAWGMSETSSAVTYSDRFELATTRDADGAVEVGDPIPGCAVRIVDAEDRVVPEKVVGAVQVRGVSVTSGTRSEAGVDRSAFTADSWLRTGDLGLLREGRLTITGREKDIVILRGANFHCHEIETVVEAVAGVLPSFAAASAVRMPGAVNDQLAVFVASAAADTAALRELGKCIRAAVANAFGATPDHLVLLPADHFPKSAIGKIQRAELRKRLAAGEFDAERRLLAAEEESTAILQPVWREITAPEAGELPPGEWTVVADPIGIGATLAAHLRSQVGSCTLVAPSAPFAPAPCGEPRNVVLLPTELFRVLEVVQALHRARLGDATVRLWIVSRRAFAVTPHEGDAIGAWGLAGLAKTLPREVAWLRCSQVDLEGADIEADAALLERELEAADGVDEVAYRAGRRWRARLAPVEPTLEPAALVTGGRYVVSGGLGGIGSLLVRALLARANARVLILGRSPADAVQSPLAELRTLGDVTYEAVDVADEPAVRAAVQAAEERWGRPLDGVFHLAGDFAPRALLEETPATFEAALRAKVKGAWVLHRLLCERPAARMVSFSSVLGVFGGALHGTYAAASTFLSGLASHQRALGLNGRCVSWSAWAETGMSRLGFASAARGRGVLLLAPEHALELLWNALRCDAPQVFVGLDVHHANVRPWLESPPPDPRSADNGFIAPQTEMERQLARIWEARLHLGRAGVQDNFFEIGGDSLQAAEILADIDLQMGIRLPMAAFFRAPTIRQLAEFVDREESVACELVSLRSAGEAPAIFCVPGALEDAGIFASFAAAMAPGRPIYAVQSLGTNESIEAIAAGAVRAILAQQPQGPFHLVGHCFGGVLAYEIAQQLAASGEDTATLVLIDTLVSDSLALCVDAPLHLRLAHFGKRMAGQSTLGRFKLVVEKAKSYYHTAPRRQRREVLARFEAMLRSYVLNPYGGRLTLVIAKDSFHSRDAAHDPRRSWARLARAGTEVLEVTGDHESLLETPHVAEVARQLDRVLSTRPSP